MEHDINLNIHYSAPEEVWESIDEVYKSMPYWAGNKKEPRWIGEGIDLWASVEAGGIQLAGTMPQEIWEYWYDALKSKLTKALGYEIGEPEDGFPFRYWKPFVKKYSDIKSIDSSAIVFHDYSTFYISALENGERDITANPPYFLFQSEYMVLKIVFDYGGLVKDKRNERDFRIFQTKLEEIGLRTRDLS